MGQDDRWFHIGPTLHLLVVLAGSTPAHLILIYLDGKRSGDIGTFTGAESRLHGYYLLLIKQSSKSLMPLTIA